MSKLAPEFYGGLYQHDSYGRVLWKFIFSPSMGVFARVKRPPADIQKPFYQNALIRLLSDRLSIKSLSHLFVALRGRLFAGLVALGAASRPKVV